MRQFCKRLHSKGFKATHTLTAFIFNTVHLDPSSPISVAKISDGYDQGGFSSAGSVPEYLQNFKTFGSKTVADVIRKHQASDDPITCIVYDSFMPWALDLAREFGLYAAPFFTQSCGVNYVNYLFYVNHGRSLNLPIKDLSFLEPQDLPTFVTPTGSHLAYFEMVLQQFTNFKEAALCTAWLNTRPERSVVYIAFGSMAQLSSVQMEELASAVRSFSYLWVVRASEESKLPSGFLESVDKDKCLVLRWSPQLEVLSNKAVGCFMTHCGWNSTMEGLTLGVPMVAMPQWTDQPMNAKYIQDVWKVGVRVKAEKETGVAMREEIEFSIKEVMEGEKSKEMKKNAMKWRDLAVKSLSEGGSTDININIFASKIQTK